MMSSNKGQAGSNPSVCLAASTDLAKESFSTSNNGLTESRNNLTLLYSNSKAKRQLQLIPFNLTRHISLLMTRLPTQAVSEANAKAIASQKLNVTKENY